MRKGHRYLIGGKLLCRKCEKEAKIVRAESDRLSVLSMQLDAKRKNLADEMRKEKSKRLKLEDNIARRLYSTGEYTLEGRDVKLLPNGVACARQGQLETKNAKLVARLDAMSGLQRSRLESNRTLKVELIEKKDELEKLKCAAHSQEKITARQVRVAESAAVTLNTQQEEKNARLESRLRKKLQEARILKSKLVDNQEKMTALECDAESHAKVAERETRLAGSAHRLSALSKEKASAAKKARDVAECTLKTLRSTVRTVHQRHRRLIGKSLLQGAPDVQVQMAKSLRALELEVAAYQAEQQQLKNELAQLRTTVARQKVYTIDLSLAQFIIHNKKLFITKGVHRITRKVCGRPGSRCGFWREERRIYVPGIPLCGEMFGSRQHLR